MTVKIDSELITNHIMGYLGVTSPDYKFVREAICKFFGFSPFIVIDGEKFTVAYTSPLVEKIEKASFYFFAEYHLSNEVRQSNSKAITKIAGPGSIVVVEWGEYRLENGRPIPEDMRKKWCQILQLPFLPPIDMFGWDDPSSLCSRGVTFALECQLAGDKVNAKKAAGQVVLASEIADLKTKIAELQKIQSSSAAVLKAEIPQRRPVLQKSIQANVSKKVAGKSIYIAGLTHVVECFAGHPKYSIKETNALLQTISSVVLYPTIIDERYQKELSNEIAEYLK